MDRPHRRRSPCPGPDAGAARVLASLPGGAAAAERAQTARTTVSAVLGALAPVVALLATVMATGGGVSGRWFAGVAGAALLLRARAALFTPEVVRSWRLRWPGRPRSRRARAPTFGWRWRPAMLAAPLTLAVLGVFGAISVAASGLL